MNALATAETMKITKLREHIGAEVTGIDLRMPIDTSTRQRLNDAVADSVVLVIRDQEFTAAQYQSAAELFGELMEDQNRRYLVDGLPLVSVLSNRHKDSQGNPAKLGKNATWHTDHTNQERPPSSRCFIRWRCRIEEGPPRSATCAPPTRRSQAI